MKRTPHQTVLSALPTLIGWQGIRLRVPEGWFLNGFSGNAREGLLHIASPGAFSVEVKWVRTKKSSDLRLHLNRYLDQIERDARKRKQSFTGRIEPLSERQLEFIWRTDRKAIGLISRCETCGCILLAQVSGSRNDHVHTLARQILGTLQDHPEDGWVEWSLYGLHVAIPERFDLESHRLITGHTRLLFRYHRERLLVERFAQAEQLLRDWSLEEWAKTGVEWHRWRGHSEPSNWREHEGARFSGRLRGLAWLRELTQALMRLHRPALRTRAALWFCPKRNLLLHISHQGPRPSNLLEQIMERAVCH